MRGVVEIAGTVAGLVLALGIAHVVVGVLNRSGGLPPVAAPVSTSDFVSTVSQWVYP